MSIYLEDYNNKKLIGLSIIDISTGENYIHKIISNNDVDWIEDISRYMNIYNPIEILFHSNININKTYIQNTWDITHDSIHINLYSNINDFKNKNYQNKILERIFKNHGLLSGVEYIDLEFDEEALLSYIYLLEFINEHEIDIINNINKPIIKNDEKYLILSNNSARQLNIINNYNYLKSRNDSLLSVTNECCTNSGKRLWKDRILYPIIDIEKLNKRYEKVDYFIKDELYKNIRSHLSKITSDNDKILRKMSLKLLQPYNLFSYYLSFNFISNIINILLKHNYIKDIFNIEELNKNVIDYININNITFNFDNFTNDAFNKMTKSLFNKGIYNDLDILEEEVNNSFKEINIIIKDLSYYIDSKKDNIIKLDYSEKYNWHLHTTLNRYNILKSKLNSKRNINKEKLDNSDISIIKKDKNNVIISFNNLNKLLNIINKNKKKIIELNEKYYKDSIIKLYDNFNLKLKEINDFISEIDVICNSANISIKNNYTKPVILDRDSGYINCKDIRHPIVEKIHTDTEYVTNDVILGDDNSILLFGTNACGKSTLMKAIGLSIVLAQSGCYVPASDFKFSPYTQLFTRILNNDNIFRSQSSFAVEMIELKPILEKSNNKSLILGDELCSGTETISAISIIAASILELSRKKSTFILTTHFHQLMEQNIIKDLNNLKIYHLKVNYENDILTYNRKLSPGSGPSSYGLIVCKAMKLDSSFIKTAKDIQSKLLNKSNMIINNKSSKYNNNIKMDRCNICDSTNNLETHHINEQKDADNNNNIKHFHKNISHNLVPLCKDCHLKVTHGGLEIYGYLDTSEGIKLNYKFIDNNKNKKKYNQEKINIILSYKDKKFKKNDIINLLKINNDIVISKSTLNKIFTGTY